MTTGPGMSCPVLWAVPGEPDQLVRLTAFRVPKDGIINPGTTV